MKHLFFDTETTGLPFNDKKPGDPEYPHIMQLAYILTDDKFKILNQVSTYVRLPDEAIIHPKAFEAHGLTKEFVNEHGISCEIALMHFNEMLLISDRQIAHNFKFDYLLTKKAEAYYFKEPFIEFTDSFCTMLALTNIIKLPGKGKMYKWPKLEEAYKHYYKQELVDAHDALADCIACMKVYKAYSNNQNNLMMPVVSNVS